MRAGKWDLWEDRKWKSVVEKYTVRLLIEYGIVFGMRKNELAMKYLKS